MPRRHRRPAHRGRPGVRSRIKPDEQGGTVSAVARFAREYGWWRVFAIPVLAVITVLVLVDIFAGGGPSDAPSSDNVEASGQADSTVSQHGPDPAESQAAALSGDGLPQGGKFTQKGDGTFREVGTPGLEVGRGEKKVVRYALAIENGVDTSAYGGDDAFAAMVDATLSDPRGWTADPAFKFVHVAASDFPDTTIQLASLDTTAERCGAQLHTETSCHTTITGESTVILNESRWVRGAVPFEGDVGNYRQYLINHEFGHAIGYAEHQACGGQGKLAPVMMQQTISLNNATLKKKDPEEIYPDQDVTCEPNPWPYPTPGNENPHNPEAKPGEPEASRPVQSGTEAKTQE